jgi:hypothetical protein
VNYPGAPADDYPCASLARPRSAPGFVLFDTKISVFPDEQPAASGDGLRTSAKEVEMLLAEVVVMLCVVAILAFGMYAVLRPFTHLHYHHESGRLWRPLD